MGRPEKLSVWAIQHILENIINNLKLNELKIMRLVSRELNKIASHAMLKVTRIRLNEDNFSDFPRLVEKEESLFCEIPFADSFVFDDMFGPLEELKKFYPIWDQICLCIKHLNMVEVTFVSHEELRSVLFVKCPNLITLKMFEPRIRKSETEDHMKFDFRTILHHSLKKLYVHAYGTTFSLTPLFLCYKSMQHIFIYMCDNDSHYMVIRSMKDATRQCTTAFTSVKSLDIIVDGPLIPLVAAGVREYFNAELLEKFAVRVKRKESLNELRSIRDITEKWSSTLKSLQYDDFDSSSLDEVLRLHNCRRYDNLEILKLRGSKLNSFGFFVATPNITKLCIFLNDLELNDENVLPRLDNCVHFEVGLRKRELISDELAKFRNMLPSVVKMRVVGITDKTFSVLCAIWSNLVSLELLNCRLTDDGFDDITSLQNLESLSYDYKTRYKDPPFPILTDDSVINGIMRMTKLRHLYAHNILVTGARWDDTRRIFSQRRDFRPLNIFCL